ncbi:type IV secretion system protein [Blastomonas sp.]|uniref:type IV secretion system protein n=1 Tax=Blastomonas sp. TaxID=1909299 RepID=UPI00359353CA
MLCPAPTPGGSFLGDTLRFVDCQAQTIGSAGYQALASPGSPFWIILTGLLTVFVALFGFRMLLGQVPSVREGVLAFVKIGIVLVLATSWPAYRTLVYDIAISGPAELSAQIGGASGVPGATGGMVARLEATDAAMVALAIKGAGLRSANSNVMPPLFANFEPFALGGSRILFLIGILGAFGAVRLIAGLLLAVAPLFIAFVLFDSTRGLFEGWLRVLAGAALGALGTAIILGVELALLEPWLSSLLAARAAGIAVPSAPVELLVVTLLFVLVLAAMLWAFARVAIGFRFAHVWPAALTAGQPRDQAMARTAVQPVVNALSAQEGRSRAAVVADAIASDQRREALQGQQLAGGGSAGRVPVQAVMRDAGAPPAVPLGQSYRRRTSNRVSASAGQRDLRA